MQEILDMVRYVAVFYLLEQTVLNLLPAKFMRNMCGFIWGFCWYCCCSSRF